MGLNSDHIFNLSPKKLAVYLVIAPLLLLLAHTLITITFQTISRANLENETTVYVLFGILYLVLSAIIFLWLFWLQLTVNVVEENQLNLPRKWFKVAYAFLCFFVIFNVIIAILEFGLLPNNNIGLFNVAREFVNFGGIIIAYPIVCHYAARAATSNRIGKPATFVNSIPFTLFLIFGVILGIPFLHKHFTKNPSTNSEIMMVYAIAAGLFISILILGFIAAITGLV